MPCRSAVLILSPSLFVTGLDDSLDDTSLFTEGRGAEELLALPDSPVAVAIIFLGGVMEEIFLSEGELDVTVLGSELLPEVLASLIILCLMGEASCAALVLDGVMRVVTEGL